MHTYMYLHTYTLIQAFTVLFDKNIFLASYSNYQSPDIIQCDNYMLGMDMKKPDILLFRTSTTRLTIQLCNSKILTKMHWLLYDSNIPSLNAVKMLTVQLTKNFKNFESTYQYFVDCQPACRKTRFFTQ